MPTLSLLFSHSPNIRDMKCVTFVLLLNLSLISLHINAVRSKFTSLESLNNKIGNARDTAGVFHNSVDDGLRLKRETELMDLEESEKKDGDAVEQETFWTRVARVCMNMLRRFLTWLNE